MKKLFYTTFLLCFWSVLGLNGFSNAYGQCPTTTPVVSDICISQGSNFDVRTFALGAEVAFFSDAALTNPAGPLVGAGSYFVVFTDTTTGANCTPATPFSVSVRSQPPIQSLVVCANPLFELAQVAGIDKFYTDPNLSAASLVIADSVPPGTYYGVVDAQNTGNNCESEPMVLTVLATPPAPTLAGGAASTDTTICGDPAGAPFDLYAFGATTTPAIEQWYSDAALSVFIPVGATVGPGTYYGVYLSPTCISEAFVLTISAPEAAPAIEIGGVATTTVCDTFGTGFDLDNVVSTNPAAVTLIFFDDAAITDSIYTSGGGGAGQFQFGPDTVFAVYVGSNGCLSEPTAIIINPQPQTLGSFNCTGVPGPGTCTVSSLGGVVAAQFSTTITPDSIILTLFCSPQIPDEAAVSAIITQNQNYLPGASLNFIDDDGTPIADFDAQLAADFAAAPTTTTFINNGYFVTQTSPDGTCTSDTTALFVQVRPQPDVVATPETLEICAGDSINIYDYVEDVNGNANVFYLYTDNPLTGPAVAVDTASATNGDPDPGQVARPLLGTPGTYTYYIEGVDEFPVGPSCSDVDTFTIVVRPLVEIAFFPSENDTLTVCSDDPVQFLITDPPTILPPPFPGANPIVIPGAPIGTPGVSPVANVDITVEIDGGLNARTTPAQGAGLGGASTLTSPDTFENITSGILYVRYIVTPNDTSFLACPGVTDTLVVCILPEPVGVANQADTVCSEQEAQVFLSTVNGLANVQYEVTGADFDASAMTYIGGVGFPGGFPDTITDDTLRAVFLNQTTARETAVFSVVPLSPDTINSGAGAANQMFCAGDTFTVTVYVDPAPVLDTIVDTVCSGGTTNLQIAYPTSPISVDSIRFDAPVLSSADMTGPSTGSGSAQPGVFVATPIQLQETFTNTDTTVETATYTVIGKNNTFGCSDTGIVIINVIPEPIFDTTNFPTLCDNDPTLNIDNFQPIIVNAVPGSGQWFMGTDATGMPLNGVQTLSNGSKLYYQYTVQVGSFTCNYGVQYNVILEEAADLTSPLPGGSLNIVLCADGVNAQSNNFSFDTLAKYTPTATNSGGVAAGSGYFTLNGDSVPDPSAPIRLLNGDEVIYIFTATNGCVTQLRYEVFINPLPTAVVTGGGAICPPANAANDVLFTFTGTGPFSFIYTDGTDNDTVMNNIVNPFTVPGAATTIGEYQVLSITDGNGCSTPNNYPGSNSVVVVDDSTPVAICLQSADVFLNPTSVFLQASDLGTFATACNQSGTITQMALPMNPLTCDSSFGCLGRPILATYTVTNTATGKSSSCQVPVSVLDKFNPNVGTCPTDTVSFGTDNPLCTWTVPDAQLDPANPTDNCQVDEIFYTIVGGAGINNAPANLATLQGVEFNKGVTEVKWTVQDKADNEDSCSFFVEVLDDDAPIITQCATTDTIFTSSADDDPAAPAFGGMTMATTDTDGDCLATIPDMRDELLITENCPLPLDSIVQSPAPGTSVAPGQTAVSFTVTDCGGNVDVCTITLTVLDDEAPSITCPGDTTVDCDEIANYLTLGFVITGGTTSDNCTALPTVTLADAITPGSCPSDYVVSRTYTSTDAQGNSTSCFQTITVQDTTPPVITDVTVTDFFCFITDLPRLDYAAYLALGGTASDNCTLDTATFCFHTSTKTGNCPQTVVDFYTIADSCGNIDTAAITYTINDTTPPVVDVAAADVTFECDSIGPNPVSTFTDNCTLLVATQIVPIPGEEFVNDPSQCAFYTYGNFVIYTATDDCGNSVSDTVEVRVEDTEAPVVTAPADLTVGTDGLSATCDTTFGSGALVPTSVTDNCASLANLTQSVIVTNAAGDTVLNQPGDDAAGVYTVGVYTIEFTAVDPCGNSGSDSFTLTVVDDDDPVIACVATFVAELDSTGNFTFDAGDLITSSTDNCAVVDTTIAPASVDCSDVGPVTVTVTISDAAGNSDDCQIAVDVQDNIAPTNNQTVCLDADTVYLDGFCQAMIDTADFLLAGAPFDACGISTVGIASPGVMNGNSTTLMVDLGNLTLKGINPPVPVTITFEDVNGNTSTCVVDVAVLDTIPPAITCASPAPVFNEPGVCDAFVTIATPSLGDNCLVTTLINSYTGLPTASARYPVGITPVTWTVFDRAGNSTTCLIQVEVIDNEDPVAVCAPFIAMLDATGNVTIDPSDVDGGSTDNCPNPVLTLNDSSFDCSDIGANTVTLTITDASGNTDQCNATVIVQDNINPTAVCQPATVYLDANGAASIVAADVDGGSFDNCPNFTLGVFPSTFDCTNLGTNNVTLTALDGDGTGSSSCVAVVTVLDTLDPTAVCKDIDVQLGPNGLVTVFPTQIENGSSDNCFLNNAAASVTPNTFGCADTGFNTVTYTVVDQSGNTGSCSAQVLVKDQRDPSASCRNLTLQLDAFGQGSITVSDINNGSSDNCGIVDTFLTKTNFDCDDVGMNMDTLYAVDAAGNTGFCIAMVTVQDNVPPVAECVDSLTLYVDAAGSVSITTADVDDGSNDACGIATLALNNTTFTCADLGFGNSTTLTVVDNNGNISTCTTPITVLDTINPTITAPDSLVFCNDPTVCQAALDVTELGNVSSDDNCTVVTETYSFTGPTSGGGAGLDASGTFLVGTYTITYTAIDQSGNTTTATTVVTVEDCEQPVISNCPGDIVVSNVTNNCDQTVSWFAPTATDNCAVTGFAETTSDPTIFISPVMSQQMFINATQPMFRFASFPTGVTTVTYTVVDAAGNTSICDFTVSILDTVPPTFANCPAGGMVMANTDPGNCQATVIFPQVTAQDNCLLDTLFNDAPKNNVFTPGTTPVTFTAIDASGNVVTCTFDVMVVDNEAPTLTFCPSDTVIGNDPGQCGAIYSFPTPTATDNCGVTSIAQTAGGASGSFFAVGTDSVAFEFKDAEGNTTVCDFSVTVEDREDPEIFTIPDVIVANDTGICGAVVNFPAFVEGTVSGNPSTSSYAVGTATYAPATVPGTANVTGASGDDDTDGPIALPFSFEFFETGYTSIWVSTNGWVSFSAPSFGSSDFSNDVLPSTNGQENLIAGAWDDLTATSISTFTMGTAPNRVFVIDFDASHLGAGENVDFQIHLFEGTNVIQIHSIDVQADASDLTMTQGIEDATGTTAFWPAGRNNTNWSATASAVEFVPNGPIASASNVFSDNCPGATVAQINGLPSGSTFPVDTTINTFVVTDAAGNTDTASFLVIVEDTEDPTLVCLTADTIGTDLGVCGGTYVYSFTAADNCAVTDTTITGGASGVFLPVGTNTITIDIADAAGNTATCTWDVEVEDTEAPTIATIADTTLSNDPGDCSAVFTYPAFLEDCGGLPVPSTSTYTVAPLGPAAALTGTGTSVHSGADDAISGAIALPFTFSFFDNDYTDVYISSNGWISFLATTSSNLATQTLPNTTDPDAVIAGVWDDLNDADVSYFTSGTAPNRVFVIDYDAQHFNNSLENVDFQIHLFEGTNRIEIHNIDVDADVTDPTATQGIENETGTTAFVVPGRNNSNWTATDAWAFLPAGPLPGSSANSFCDNCPGATVAQIAGLPSGSAFPVGTTVNTFVVTDAAGNSDTASFSVTVEDVEAPVITCPANVTVTQDTSLFPTCGAVATYAAATATDNCGVLSIVETSATASGSVFAIGTTTVEFVATDTAGNADTCTFTVTVDPLPATALINGSATPADIDLCFDDPNTVISLNAPGAAFTSSFTVMPLANVTTGYVPGATSASLSFSATGTYVVTYTIVNNCAPGQQATATLTINVNELPTVVASVISNPSTIDAADGSVAASASGGMAPYGYSWVLLDRGNRVPVGTGSPLGGLENGLYEVTVTDAKGCSAVDTVELRDPTPVKICDVEDYDRGQGTGFGVQFDPTTGANIEFRWGSQAKFYEYPNGDIYIFGELTEKGNPNNVWNADIYLINREWWPNWQAMGNTFEAGNATGVVGSGMTFYVLDGTRSTITGKAGSGVAGGFLELAQFSNPTNTAWQYGARANRQDNDYGLSGEFSFSSPGFSTVQTSGTGLLSIDLNGCFSTVRIRPIAMLEGPYNATTNLMEDDLRANNLLPTNEPFTGLGYTHAGQGGGEQIAAGVLNTTGNDAIVEWVLVELRDATNPNTVVASRSALVQRDGDIVDTDGISAVSFEQMAEDDYYVAIYHRNHLQVMTAQAIALDFNTVTTLDFTSPAFQTFGLGSQNNVNGRTMLFGGDANGDGQIQNTDDQYFWTPTVGGSGLLEADYDLDGQVQNSDKVGLWIKNVGKGTAVPQ